MKLLGKRFLVKIVCGKNFGFGWRGEGLNDISMPCGGACCGACKTMTKIWCIRRDKCLSWGRWFYHKKKKNAFFKAMVRFKKNASFFCLTASKTASKNEGRKTNGNLNQKNPKNVPKRCIFWKKTNPKNAPLGFVFRVRF